MIPKIININKIILIFLISHPKEIKNKKQRTKNKKQKTKNKIEIELLGIDNQRRNVRKWTNEKLKG